MGEFCSVIIEIDHEGHFNLIYYVVSIVWNSQSTEEILGLITSNNKWIEIEIEEFLKGSEVIFCVDRRLRIEAKLYFNLILKLFR